MLLDLDAGVFAHNFAILVVDPVVTRLLLALLFLLLFGLIRFLIDVLWLFIVDEAVVLYQLKRAQLVSYVLCSVYEA